MAPKDRRHPKSQLQVNKRGEGNSKGSKENPENSKEKPSSNTPVGKQASATERKPSGSNGQRKTSGVNPRKVSEGLKQLPPDAYRFVRESYLMLDSDGTGSVSRETMKDMLASLGMRDRNDERLNVMLQRTGEPITFAGYLAVMGELLADLPTQEEMSMMLEAFQNPDGTFNQAEMKRSLMQEGMSEKDVDTVISRFAKPSRYGESFDPKAFANAMSI